MITVFKGIYIGNFYDMVGKQNILNITFNIEEIINGCDAIIHFDCNNDIIKFENKVFFLSVLYYYDRFENKNVLEKYV